MHGDDKADKLTTALGMREHLCAMDHSIWWDGIAGALMGAVLGSVIGSGIPLFSAWKNRRVERQGELLAMDAEMFHTKIALKKLVEDNSTQTPAYRLPLVMFAVPKLMGEGLLTENGTAALVEYVMSVEEVNRGLDHAAQAAAANQGNAVTLAFNNARRSAERILNKKLPRLDDRTVFDAAEQTLSRLDKERKWKLPLRLREWCRNRRSPPLGRFLRKR